MLRSTPTRTRSLLLVLCLAGCKSSPQPADSAVPDGGAPSDCPAGLTAFGPACVPVLEACPGQIPKLGGGCVPVGVEPCPGGLEAADGVCRPIGPGTDCPAGWTVKESWCEPALPQAACPAGTSEVLGKTTCQPLGDCGSGTYGNLVVGAQTVYVDAGYSGGAADGSSAKPFTTITDAVAAAADGAQVAVAAGDYQGDLSITRKVTVEGRCASLVRLTGNASNLRSAIEVGAATVLLRGLTISGPKEGVSVTGGQLTLDRVEVSGCGDTGVVAVNAGLTITGSRIAGNRHMGILLQGAQGTIERSTVRDTQPQLPGNDFGTGIQVDGTTTRSALVMRDTLLAANRHIGLAVRGSDATVERSVIQDTRPQLKDLGYGYGVLGYRQGAQGAGLQLRSSVLSGNATTSVVLYGSDALLEKVVIRDTQPSAASQDLGCGVRALPLNGTGSKVTLRDSLLLRSRTVGIALSGSSAEVERSIIRDTQAQASDSTLGQAVGGLEDGALPPALTMRDSLVEKSTSGAIYLRGGSHLIERSLIKDTGPGATGEYGIGITVTAEQGAPNLVLRGSRVSGSRTIGVALAGASGTLEQSVIEGTREQLSDGKHGAGVSVTPRGQLLPTLTVRQTLVSNNRTVGVAAVGTKLDVQSLVVSGTLPQVSDKLWGVGLYVASPPTVTARIRDSLFAENRSTGVALWGVDATLERCVVRDSGPEEGEGHGIGISADHDQERGSLALLDSAVLRSRAAGLRLDVWTAKLSRCQISESVATRSENLLGDGVELIPTLASHTPELDMERCLIEKSSRAGAVLVSASGSVRASLFRGNLIPIDLEEGADPELAEDNLFEGNTSDAVARGGTQGLAPKPARLPPLPVP